MDDTTHDAVLPSGRFLLRIEPELHALLRDEAERLGLSLNEHCGRELAASVTLGGPSADLVRRAARVTDARVRGLLVFGSWARGELADSSDVDLLVVVHDDLVLERGLYRRWDDASPVRWSGRAVEPHFVHLPGRDDRVTGLWAEAAVDGIVVFDPDFDLSRHLVSIRKRIVAGTLVRREVHGHPYWVDAA